MIIYQLKTGYRYNSDTLFLYDFISKFNINKDVLEIGSGSGVLGLLLKRDFKDINLTQIDFQEENYLLNKKNASINNIQTNVIQNNFLYHNFDKKFDFIISNPPFYHDGVKKSENLHIQKSRVNIFLPLHEFIKKANSLLKPRGVFIFCYDCKDIMSVIGYLKEYKIQVEFIKFVHPRIDKLAKLVFFYAKKSSKSKCQILPPLFSHDGLDNSKQAQEIFKKADTKAIDWKF